MTNDEIINTWNQVFPKSAISCQKACFGENDYYFKGRLGKDKSEFANGIIDNDPLNYMFNVENNTYKEYNNSLRIAPTPEEGKYLAYGRSKLRMKTIKNLTKEKLFKRFREIKLHIYQNRNNFKGLLFDINEKLEVA